jgi:arylsulfatase A-like enzyme
LNPNILFIVVDSFNENKFHGKERKCVTPNLDLILSKGTYFKSTIPAAPSTLSSLSSIFTSKYPFECILRDKKNYVMDTKIENYIKILKNSGYTTNAMVPEMIKYFGLVDDFNYVTTYKSNSSIHDGFGLTILDELNHKMNMPWFYYIHLMDLHGYKKFDESNRLKKFHDPKFGINKYEQMVSALDEWLGKIFNQINLKETLLVLTADHGSEDANFTKELQEYKQNIRRYEINPLIKSSTKFSKKMPSFLNPIKSKIKEKFIQKRSKVLSKRALDKINEIQNLHLSPHEKRIMLNVVKNNYTVFDDRLKVPLLFVGSNIISGEIIHEQVRTIDIFPTIAEILNLDEKTENRGKSLIPFITGNKVDELPAFVESATNRVDMENSNVVGIRTSKYKYFRDRMNFEINQNLYDLKNDPLEENNIAQNNVDLVETMENLLTKTTGNSNFDIKERNDIFNQEEIDQVNAELKKLGYI